MSFNSWSRRDFSKGRRGVTYVLRQTQLLATGMVAYKCLQNQENAIKKRHCYDLYSIIHIKTL